MPRKIDILTTPVAEECEALELRLGEAGTSGKLFPDDFSASNTTGHISQIRIEAG